MGKEWLQEKPVCGDVNQINTQVFYRDRAVVLLYHNFQNKECGTAITPQRFRQHLDMLEREGFNIVSLADITMFLQKQRSLPPNAVAITMDDGHISNYHVAYRELLQRRWPGAIFVSVANMGQNTDNRWLNWYQLREMSQHNMSIQSHAFAGHQFIRGTYPKGDAWLTTPLPGETSVQYQNRIYNDLYKARQVLEKELGLPIESLAVPFGMYNEDVIAMAQKAHYKYNWTTVRESVTSTCDPAKLPRVSVGRKNITAMDLKETIVTIGQRQTSP